MINHGQLAKPNVYSHDIGYGEYFVTERGISYSQESIYDYFSERPDFPNDDVQPIWLEEESQAALSLAESGHSVIIEGDYAAGKSAALFGVRSLLRTLDRPYIAINGHYLSEHKVIANAINRATKYNDIVLYDSFDYLFMRNSKKGAAKNARPDILTALENHVD